MAKTIQDSNRRRIIKLTALGLAGPALGIGLAGGVASAADAEVSETDPQAAALKYKKDATKAPERKDANATCANCSLYTGKAGAATGPCTIFQNKLVAAKGWCTAWVKKA
jgi:anaerobic selenocysteine-containing dehydrogenase